MELQAFVIYSSNDPNSVALAQRCVESCRRADQNISLVEGVSKTEAFKLALNEGLHVGYDYVETQQIRPLRDTQIGCLLAHRKLWRRCVDFDEPIVIFEHDAILRSPIGDVEFRHVLNLQRNIWDDPNWPYYQKLQRLVDTVRTHGNGKYVCLPGAPAYAITPAAARLLLAVKPMLPADLFVNKYLVQIDDHPALPARVTNDYSTNLPI